MSEPNKEARRWVVLAMIFTIVAVCQLLAAIGGCSLKYRIQLVPVEESK